MKKFALAAAVIVLSFAAAGCSGKKQEEPSEGTQTSASESLTAGTGETTASPTETAGKDDEEDYEEDYVSGIITAVDGEVITVKNNDDGSEASYDISDAEVFRQFDLTAGDSVYVEYIVGEKDPLTALTLEVGESVLEQTMDPIVEGKVTEVDGESITIQTEDGKEYSLRTGNAYVVSENEIAAGPSAQITYIGELDDEPLAIKIVMEDSFGTPEAQVNGFVGTVDQIDGSMIVLLSIDDDYYNFIADGIDLSSFQEGDVVQVIYEGKLTDKAVAVSEVTLK